MSISRRSMGPLTRRTNNSAGDSSSVSLSIRAPTAPTGVANTEKNYRDYIRAYKLYLDIATPHQLLSEVPREERTKPLDLPPLGSRNAQISKSRDLLPRTLCTGCNKIFPSATKLHKHLDSNPSHKGRLVKRVIYRQPRPEGPPEAIYKIPQVAEQELRGEISFNLMDLVSAGNLEEVGDFQPVKHLTYNSQPTPLALTSSNDTTVPLPLSNNDVKNLGLQKIHEQDAEDISTFNKHVNHSRSEKPRGTRIFERNEADHLHNDHIPDPDYLNYMAPYQDLSVFFSNKSTVASSSLGSDVIKCPKRIQLLDQVNPYFGKESFHMKEENPDARVSSVQTNVSEDKPPVHEGSERQVDRFAQSLAQKKMTLAQFSKSPAEINKEFNEYQSAWALDHFTKGRQERDLAKQLEKEQASLSTIFGNDLNEDRRVSVPDSSYLFESDED